MLIAGIDIGTSGCKCTIYDKDGSFQSEAYKEYFASITEEGHLLDGKTVWESVKEVVSKAAKDVGEINAIGVTSFGEAVVLLDENDEPLIDSFLYTDPRGQEECNELIDKFGISYINNSTGLNPGPMYSICKLMWIKNNEPHIFEKCKRIMLFEDYIVYMLSGISQIDYSLAARTMVFDINKLQWNKEMLDFAGIDIDKLPKVVPIGSKAGCIKEEMASELGINKDAIIVSGCHDQIAASIGTGINEVGMAVDGTGTVECITTVFDLDSEDVNKDLLFKGNYAFVPYTNNKYAVFAVSFTGGSLLKWYRDKIAYMEAKEANKEGKSPYEVYNSKLDKENPTGLLALPYFAGSGTPYMDTEAKGAIVGLTLQTPSSAIYQALMEGVTYEMRLNIEKLKEAGIEIDTIRATGGGAKSPFWLQMKADILQKPVASLGDAQTGTLGCVMLASVACGIYSSLEEASKIFINIKEVYYPNEEKSKKYNQYYDKYKNLYKAIKNVL